MNAQPSTIGKLEPAKSSRRSRAPIFWSLFGAGGMLSALIGPALVFATGIAIPCGLLLDGRLLDYPNALAFARSIVGAVFAFVVIALFLWHAAHRLLKSVHDLGVHPGAGMKLAFYGTAAVGTLTALVALIALR
jgi:fumarate reductase subunit D